MRTSSSRFATLSAFSLLALLLALTPVLAQESGDGDPPDTDETRGPIVAPNIDGTVGGFNLGSADTPPKGTWTFGLYYNNFDRIVQEVSCLMPPLTSDWSYDRNTVDASVGYAPLDNVEISLMLPYESLDGEEQNRIGDINGREFIEEIDVDGLGNPRLGLKWRLWEQGRNGLAVNAFVEPALGDDDEGVAADDTGFGIGLFANAGNFLINLGYRDRGDGATGGGVGPSMEGTDLAEEITGGVGYIYPATDKLDWITELNGVAFQDDFPQPPDHLDLTSGVRVRLGESGQWAFNAAARFNVADYGDTDGIGGLVGLTFAPSESSRERRARLEREEAERRRQAELERQRREEEERRRQAELERQQREEEERQAELERQRREEEERRAEAERQRREELEAPEPPEVIESVCLFASGSARVDNRCQKILDREVALRMRDEPESTALVIGYSDTSGSVRVNEELSRRRAEAVKQLLVTRHGIDADRIEVEGRGETDQFGAAADNRRVVIRLTIGESGRDRD